MSSAANKRKPSVSAPVSDSKRTSGELAAEIKQRMVANVDDIVASAVRKALADEADKIRAIANTSRDAAAPPPVDSIDTDVLINFAVRESISREVTVIKRTAEEKLKKAMQVSDRCNEIRAKAAAAINEEMAPQQSEEFVQALRAFDSTTGNSVIERATAAIQHFSLESWKACRYIFPPLCSHRFRVYCPKEIRRSAIELLENRLAISITRKFMVRAQVTEMDEDEDDDDATAPNITLHVTLYMFQNLPPA